MCLAHGNGVHKRLVATTANLEFALFYTSSKLLLKILFMFYIVALLRLMQIFTLLMSHYCDNFKRENVAASVYIQVH